MAWLSSQRVGIERCLPLYVHGLQYCIMFRCDETRPYGIYSVLGGMMGGQKDLSELAETFAQSWAPSLESMESGEVEAGPGELELMRALKAKGYHKKCRYGWSMNTIIFSRSISTGLAEQSIISLNFSEEGTKVRAQLDDEEMTFIEPVGILTERLIECFDRLVATPPVDPQELWEKQNDERMQDPLYQADSGDRYMEDMVRMNRQLEEIENRKANNGRF